ncbi:hypothetical protein RHMOL_Rhmol11G0051500 [Rhododendron molle]|uniref:Uncharacterized protein n=1 Tax=Rhododendron molle TaxID=49168 RepID=A0ACC0LPN4_RHOML|nr:hypothetical protein RHMOL_Rhmol11G0051500 [Rhododendron molle]
MGLNAVKVNRTVQFSGNPLLLQVWLFEKPNVWDAPERLPYSPNHCMECRVIRQFPTEAARKGWMETRKGDQIQWVCLCLGLKAKVLGNPEYATSKVHDANLRRNVLRLWPN